MRVRDIIKDMTDGLRAAGIPSPRLEAELLCALALQTDRLYVTVHDDRELTAEEEETCRNLLAKRCAGFPMAYLAGKKEFWGRDFLTTPGVLIPRPETEILMESVLDMIPADCKGTFADLGTGTGCIGITLALERPHMRGLLLEKSPQAAALAEKNRQTLGAQNVTVVLGDLFEAPIQRKSLDVLVSNPPYIGREETEDVMPDVMKWEPKEALFSEDQGLRHLEACAKLAANSLKKGGMAAFEHGWRQGAAVRELLAAQNFLRIITKKDLAGLDRTTLASI